MRFLDGLTGARLSFWIRVFNLPYDDMIRQVGVTFGKAI